MTDRSFAQSPLAALHIDGRVAEASADPGVRLQERRFPYLLNLRIAVGDQAIRQAVGQALGDALPHQANTTSEVGGAVVCWLGPDEWLIIAPHGSDSLAYQLEAAIGGQHAALTDISDARAVIRLSGRHAREVLEKGCDLDLHATAFAIGDCAQSGLAQAAVLLRRLADPAPDETTWEIYVERSFGTYLWMWLEDAALEYELAVEISD